MEGAHVGLFEDVESLRVDGEVGQLFDDFAQQCGQLVVVSFDRQLHKYKGP